LEIVYIFFEFIPTKTCGSILPTLVIVDVRVTTSQGGRSNIWIPACPRYFYLPQYVKTSLRSTLFYIRHLRCFFPCGKAPGA